MVDSDKWIDYTIAIYKKTQSKLEKSLSYKPDDKEIISVFEQVCSFDRGERAGEGRQQRAKEREEEQEQPPTSAQLQYIEDLGGDPDKIATKKQASQEIERLKNR